jgi:hypothetical protein
VLHNDELEAHVEQEAHMEQAAHVEVEAHVEQEHYRLALYFLILIALYFNMRI